jgi:hypothetical protein
LQHATMRYILCQAVYFKFPYWDKCRSLYGEKHIYYPDHGWVQSLKTYASLRIDACTWCLRPNCGCLKKEMILPLSTLSYSRFVHQTNYSKFMHHSANIGYHPQTVVTTEHSNSGSIPYKRRCSPVFFKIISSLLHFLVAPLHQKWIKWFAASSLRRE